MCSVRNLQILWKNVLLPYSFFYPDDGFGNLQHICVHLPDHSIVYSSLTAMRTPNVMSLTIFCFHVPK